MDYFECSRDWLGTMTDRSIITAFDDKNLPILRNELMRIWEAIQKLQEQIEKPEKES